MPEPSLEFIGTQLQKLQTTITQMQFAADVDRRNAASQYDSLVAAVGIKIGAFEATVEHRLNAFEAKIEARLDKIEQRFDKIEQRFDTIETTILARFDGIERLIAGRTG